MRRRCAYSSTGGGSFTKLAGSLTDWGGVLDFHTKPQFKPVILDPVTSPG